MKQYPFLFLLLILLAASSVLAQQRDSTGIRMLGADSIAVRKVPVADSSRKKHSPRTASIRSAILPGWGQAYNRKYWKIPIVYTALGINYAIFNYNLKEYKKVRFAYFTLLNRDTANYKNIDRELQVFVNNYDVNSLQNYRNEFRKNIDYSVLFFLFFWGLNVVDATVDAHLKEFDISNDLSLKIKPSINALPNTLGLSFVFTIGQRPANHLTSRIN
jgi:hypothetical protein